MGVTNAERSIENVARKNDGSGFQPLLFLLASSTGDMRQAGLVSGRRPDLQIIGLGMDE